MQQTAVQNKDVIESALGVIGGFETIGYAFIISVALLIIINTLKYFIAKDGKLEDWGFMLLELPIDVCSILIAIIITGFIHGSENNTETNNIAHGILFIILSLIISAICCILRRFSLNYSYEEKKFKKISHLHRMWSIKFCCCGNLGVCYFKIYLYSWIIYYYMFH